MASRTATIGQEELDKKIKACDKRQIILDEITRLGNQQVEYFNKGDHEKVKEIQLQIHVLFKNSMNL